MLNLIKIKSKYPELSETFILSKIKVLYVFIKNKYPLLYEEINNFIIDNNLLDKNGINITFSEKFYLFLNDIKEFPKCNICKNQYLSYKNITKNYQKTCLKCKDINPDTKENRKKTMILKYGVENPMFLELNKEKIKLNNLIKYGTKHVFQSELVKEKIKKTNIEKYGVENPMKNSLVKLKNKQNLINKIESGNSYSYIETINGYYNILHNKCGLKFNINCQLLNKRLLLNEEICTHCNKLYKPISNVEIELKNIIYNYTKNSSINILSNKRFKNDYGFYELDIYIPEISLGIEYNGLYWHSVELGKDANYHKDKTMFFEKEGIKLIQIFEDEWLYKKEIVINRLIHIITGELKKKNLIINDNINSNINQLLKNVTNIGARKVEIREIEYKTSKEFLEKYHIQGGDSSKVKLGAYYKKEDNKEKLVGVMTFGKPSLSKGGKKSLESKKEIWELNRFAISFDYNVSGLASKFLKHFKKEYIKDKEVEIFSYADRRWSQGDVYKNLGFSLIKETDPNYYYFNNNDKLRIHRFNFRKTVLLSKYPEYNNKINELTGKSYTEFEIMSELGFYRIYDVGNLKFLMKL